MRHRLALAALVPVVLALGGMSTAQAAPTSGAPANSHGQCVSDSAKTGGQGGRSAVAKQKSTCTPPVVCSEGGNVDRDSARNTVTITGTGPGSAGSSLECETRISVTEGVSTVTFDYVVSEGTDTCGNGVPRLFVVVEDADGKTTTKNTHDGNADCGDGSVTYTIEATGTVTTVGFVYDHGDTGSVTYSNAKVGGVTLNI